MDSDEEAPVAARRPARRRRPPARFGDGDVSDESPVAAAAPPERAFRSSRRRTSTDGPTSQASLELGQHPSLPPPSPASAEAVTTQPPVQTDVTASLPLPTSAGPAEQQQGKGRQAVARGGAGGSRSVGRKRRQDTVAARRVRFKPSTVEEDGAFRCAAIIY